MTNKTPLGLKFILFEQTNNISRNHKKKLRKQSLRQTKNPFEQGYLLIACLTTNITELLSNFT